MLRNAIHGAPSWLGRVGQGIFVALILLPLFFTPAHAASLTLSWTDASTNEDGFHVQRKTGTGGTYATLTTTAAGTTGYVDGTVTAGTTYCYHVSAYNSAGDSAFSNEACAAPASATMYTVAVTKAGTGSGTVASSPAAINCGSTCSASIANGTSLALSATPAAGSTFTGWSGAYTGTGNCALVVDNNKNLTATFALSASTTYALTLTKAGTGSGTVTSSPTGINCGSTCSTSFNSGTSVTLTAAATAGSTFTGWSGACTGTGTCSVTMSAARSVTATFTTGTQSAKAAMVTPTPGSTLPGTSATFTWSVGSGAIRYQLQVGTTAGGLDVYNYSQGTNLSATVGALPAGGSPVYVRLWTQFATGWQYTDYTYTGASGATAAKAAMVTPTPGSTLAGSSVTFTWSAGSRVDQYQLQVGTTAGGLDVYNYSQGTNLSATVGALPAGGRLVYVRLWSRFGTTWLYTDYTYTGASGATAAKAAMVTPTPGSTLPGTSATFTWSVGSGAIRYQLQVGTTAGGLDVYNYSQGTNLSATVGALPAGGSPVYVRLWTQFATGWQYTDYTYTGASGATAAKAAMVTPTPGSTLAGSSVTFTWSAGSRVDQYQLQVGTTAGGLDVYNYSQGTNLSATVGALPAGGRLVYVRLWSRFGTTWLYTDYTYTSAR